MNATCLVYFAILDLAISIVISNYRATHDAVSSININFCILVYKDETSPFTVWPLPTLTINPPAY